MAFTRILCPVCGGERFVDRDDMGGKRLGREPCPECKGKKYVTWQQLERICKRYKEVICELECKLKAREK